MNEQYKKLGKNTFWMTIGNFASKLLSFFMVPLYTSYLSTSDYGVSDLITTTVSLLSPFLTLAASEGIIRFALDKNSDNKDTFSFSMFIGVIGFTILLLLSPAIAPHTSFNNYYFLFLIYYVVSVASLLFQQFVKGLDHVRSYAISGFLATLTTVTFNILFLVVLKTGVEGYLYSMILGLVIPSIYLFIREHLYEYFKSINKINKHFAVQYLRYCLPLMPNQISWWINNSSDKYIMNFFWGLSLTGIYSVAYKIPSILNVISTIFFSSWQISAIDDFGTEKSKRFFSNVYERYFEFYAVVASLLILFIKVAAKILFAKEFYNAWPYSSILIIASMIQAMGTFIGTVYTTSMKSKMILISTVLAAAVNTGLNFLLIPKIGAYGASIATAIGYGILLIVRLVDSKKIFNFKIHYIKHVVVYSLLIIQTTFMCLDLEFKSLFIAGCITMIICIINSQIFKDIIKFCKQLMKRC
jgi:O-antigen/teichoic acid export membrane protein